MNPADRPRQAGARPAARVGPVVAGLLLATLGLVRPAEALAQGFVEPCVRSETFNTPATSGASDYRNQRRSLRVVEANHFTPPVENLIRGRTGTLAMELSFVLHAFPNHHRALATLIRYGEREKSLQPGNLDYSIECYFKRALVFRADDVVVRMLFADYLGRLQRADEAVWQLERARTQAADSALTQYNVGLLYFQLGRFPEATRQAHRAIELGLPATELVDKLKAKGQWTEPSAPIAEPAASASAPASAPEAAPAAAASASD